ncbi:hypothetical protein JW796_01015 [Candidatus Dojkabacteria bacterium]|nr:hypothetical protein [Candidatus Dojkabacteria bacterium]
MTTRTRSVVITTILSFFFVGLQLISFEFITEEEVLHYFIRSALLSSIMLLGFYWTINFNMNRGRFLSVLTFPSVITFIFSFFSELLLFTSFRGLGRIPFLVVSGLLFWLVSYITILTGNILNVSVLTKIPLGQAGKAAQYVLILIASYLGYSILFSLGISPVIRLGLIFMLTFYLTYSGFWMIQLSKSQLTLSVSIISFTVLFASFVLSIWPLSVAYVALILSVIVYMTLGVGLEIRERIGFFTWIEYSFLFLVILIIAVLFAPFGINGTLL